MADDGGLLECAGVFELVVPAGWRVTGVPGKSYDLSAPPWLEVGVNISVYDDADPYVRPEVAEMVRHFGAHVGVEGDEELAVVLVPGPGAQQRAFARFRTVDREWFVGALQFPGAYLLATANGPLGNTTALDTGEALVASIAPAPAPRGRFRLRRR